MRYGSVCSGIEAASLAWAPLGWRAAFVSEVEPFPSAVLMERWGATKPKRPLLPEAATSEKDRKQRESWLRAIDKLPGHGTLPNLGDFTKIQEGDYDGNIDLLVGGCSCQSYSIAGLRKGLEDPRGNLTLEFVRLAYRSRVRWLVFENVPGILSSGERGSDFAQFLSLLVGWEVPVPKRGWRTAGIVTNAPGAFGVAWRVLDAQYTRVASFPRAVPQRRRRLILVGYLGDWRRAAQVFFDGDLRSRDTPPRRTTRAAPAGDSAPGAGSGCLRMRSGKEGGGKGALVGEELSHTLATGNDQVCFDLREGGNTASNLSPALLATDHKGGKAVSFFPQFLGKGTAPTEECCGTLINAGAPGHSNAVVLFDNHNGSRFSEQTEAANAVIAHYGTGGNNTPLVLNEAFGFQKNDAGATASPNRRKCPPRCVWEAAPPSPSPRISSGERRNRAATASGYTRRWGTHSTPRMCTAWPTSSRPMASSVACSPWNASDCRECPITTRKSRGRANPPRRVPTAPVTRPSATPWPSMSCVGSASASNG